MGFNPAFNPLNAELNPICHLLALLGAHHILHVSRLRVKGLMPKMKRLRGRNPAFTTITRVIVKAQNQNLSLLRNTRTTFYLTTRITTPATPFRVSAGNTSLAAFPKCQGSWSTHFNSMCFAVNIAFLLQYLNKFWKYFPSAGKKR